MAEISTYSNSAPVVGTDKLLGSDALGNTKNFSASDLANYVLGSSNGAVTTKTGAITIAVADINTFILYGTSSGVITLPASTDTTVAIGSSFQIQLTVSGSCTISPGAGVTINGTATLSSQYQTRTVKRISSTVWTIF